MIKARGNYYFDSARVINALGRARAGVAKKQGFLIRNLALKSIKNSRVAALPGEPPHSRIGWKHARKRRRAKRMGMPVPPKLVGQQRGIKDIRFDYDTSNRVAIIGAIKFTWSNEHKLPIPALMEVGGADTVNHESRGIIPALYRPHPYMEPALNKARPQLAGVWANSIKP